MAMFPCTRFQVFHNFITYFEAREMNDADEFISVFPDLSLPKF
jgi:hypothetical protein